MTGELNILSWCGASQGTGTKCCGDLAFYVQLNGPEIKIYIVSEVLWSTDRGWEISLPEPLGKINETCWEFKCVLSKSHFSLNHCKALIWLTGSLLNINYLHDTVVGARGLIKSHKMSLPSKSVKSCLEAKLLWVERDQYLTANAKCGRIELSLTSPPGF